MWYFRHYSVDCSASDLWCTSVMQPECVCMLPLYLYLAAALCTCATIYSTHNYGGLLLCAGAAKQAVTAKPLCYISHLPEEWLVPYCRPVVTRRSLNPSHTLQDATFPPSQVTNTWRVFRVASQHVFSILPVAQATRPQKQPTAGIRVRVLAVPGG